MKNQSILLIALFWSFLCNAQDITGAWNSILNVQGTQLRLVLNVSQNNSAYEATLDSPDQGAMGIPITSITFSNDSLNFEILNLNASYIGQLGSDNMIKGTFTQGGISFPLDWSREQVEKVKPNRPQEPKEPFPYYSEEVSIENAKDALTLAGTLTLPSKEGKHPVAILISGSGPQNRNEELMGHKPFLVLADHLTKNGIGVLRYDDRGTAESTGEFSTATSRDFANDVHAIIKYLKTRDDIDHAHIGLIGHSEGGLIAPMVASETEDIDFIVLLAGPGITGYDILMVQSELISKANGLQGEILDTELKLLKGILDIAVSEASVDSKKTQIADYLDVELDKSSQLLQNNMSKEQLIKRAQNQYGSAWFQYFLVYDPTTSLEKVKCPVLAINGEKDLQVPPKENLSAIEAALKKGGNQSITIKELPTLNHLFQESTTGSPLEYEAIEQTFAPVALEVVSNWILEHLE